MKRGLKFGFYAYRFLSDFTPVYALYPLFFQSKGVSEAGISALFMVLSVTVLALELPTGALADLIDRRIILTLSAFMKATAFLLWFLWPNPFGFALGLIAWGAGISLESGCWQAFIHDELSSEHRSHEFRSLFASMLGTSFVAVLISGIVGSVLFQIFNQYSIILLVSTVALMLAGLVPFFFPRSAHRERTRSPSLRQHVKEAIAAWRRNPRTRWLVLTAAALGGIKGSLDEYHGLLLTDKAIQVAAIPLIYAGFTLMGAIVFFLVSRNHRTAKAARLVWLMALVGALIFSVALLPVWFAVVALFLMNAIDSLARVDTEALLQSSIDSDATRATITSASSFIMQLISLLVYGISVLIVRQFPLTVLYCIGGAVLVLMSFYQWGQVQKKVIT